MLASQETEDLSYGNAKYAVYLSHPGPHVHHNFNDTGLNCSTDSQEFGQWMKHSVSISSVLSIIGALLVIVAISMKPPSKEFRNRRQSNRSPTPLDTPYGSSTARNNVYGSQPSSSTSVQTTIAGSHGIVIADDEEEAGENRQQAFCSNVRLVKRPAIFILISISVADILVAVSHLWGVLSSYEYSLSHHRNHTRYDYAECGAQAFLSVFGTISSLLWSDMLMFVAVVIFWCSEINAKRLTSVYAFMVYCILGWLVPFLVVLILGAGVNAFGFAEGIGWCYMNLNNGHRNEDLLIAWFSYDLWANLSVLFITGAAFFFCLIVCANCLKDDSTADTTPLLPRDPRETESRREQRRLCNQLVCKMVTAAVCVVVLRIWSLIINVYLFKPFHSEERNKYLCNQVLQIFSGIGTSSQGIVNAFLFVFLPGFIYLCRLCKNKVLNRQ